VYWLFRVIGAAWLVAYLRYISFTRSLFCRFEPGLVTAVYESLFGLRLAIMITRIVRFVRAVKLAHEIH
jgi:hypothetical protein